MATDILLLGAQGQVGWELCRALAPVGRINAIGRSQCDLTDVDAVVELIRSRRPDLVVNAAAYTAVDRAETEPALAMRINAELPAVLAAEAKRLGALLVDYSTDYVFDGGKTTPYVEIDETNPGNVYGRSKLAGLRAIEASGCRHLVFRVSWVYGARGANFLKTMLRLAGERTELRVVADQIGSPTSAEFIADVTAQTLSLLGRGKGDEGVFHLAPAGETAWHGFACAIVEEARMAGAKLALGAAHIVPITAAEYPLPAARPPNSRMDCGKLVRTFGLHLPHWADALPRIVEEAVARDLATKRLGH
ncbi:MAG: dTDP-4-dehydrorhamnose reductase [Porticoccaceae bacterium]